MAPPPPSDVPPSSDGSVPPSSVPASAAPTVPDSRGASMDSLGETSAEGLRQELLLARRERAEFEAQYKGLLGKLTQMRSTLGERLRRDAEELEQREAQVSSLTNQVDSLTSTASTLQEELAASNAEAERLHTELQSFKQISTEPDKNHTLALEHRLREVLEEVERLKLQVQHWKSNAQSEQALRDQAEEGLVTLRESKVTAETYASTLHDQLSAEKQTTRELQDVLAELEASKAEEVAGASIEAQQELERLSSQLEVQTRMAQAAEKQRDECSTAAAKSQALEQEVKERNLLIGKLRHEAVILNEHLTEALRRLRTESSENNVDRRLITNLFLQFHNTPRADAKRYEMLNVMASILGWNEQEREAAGLCRKGHPLPPRASPPTTNSPSAEEPPTAAQHEPGLETTKTLTRNEVGSYQQSFTRMFVQFLLREADGGNNHNSSGSGEKEKTSNQPSTENQA